MSTLSVAQPLWNPVLLLPVHLHSVCIPLVLTVLSSLLPMVCTLFVSIFGLLLHGPREFHGHTHSWWNSKLLVAVLRLACCCCGSFHFALFPFGTFAQS